MKQYLKKHSISEEKALPIILELIAEIALDIALKIREPISLIAEANPEIAFDIEEAKLLKAARDC